MQTLTHSLTQAHPWRVRLALREVDSGVSADGHQPSALHWCVTDRATESCTRLRTLVRLLRSVVLPSCIAMGWAGAAHAGIASSPLYLTTPVEPNVMFILDDSGSMHWDVVPDNSKVFFTFPRPAVLYGTNYSDYYGIITLKSGSNNGVAGFDLTNRYARYFRTAQFNPLYYDPAKRYMPWRNADGSLMANAVPTAALLNPMKLTEGTRNLTITNSHAAVWINDDGSESEATVSYYPATYFKYKGSVALTGPTDSNNKSANFDLVEIKSTTPSYPKAAARTDCMGSTCTYAEEMQNFANWFTYYRSRILASRAGIGNAFSQQGTTLRVGFGAINKGSTSVDGVSHKTIIRGVRTFSGTNRENFFTSLYTHNMVPQGTPLRRALDDAGIYYSRADNSGPWSETPGTASTAAHLECRQSHTILMTDGYWNGDAASTAAAKVNVDGTGGPTITGPKDKSFTYDAVSPFSDGNSDTLADIAMYYWKRDLRTDLVNAVPTNKLDVAFWQHMTTFGIGLGVNGSIDPATAFKAIEDKTTITWPKPATNPALLDDLLHASVNGRGGFFSAADPDVFAAELAKVLKNIVDRTSSSAAVASNSTQLKSSTHLYQALFKSGDWTGHLKAYPLKADGTIGTEIWDAGEKVPTHGSRNIKTWDGTAGADFSGTVGALSLDEVNYLRGDDAKEVKHGGAYRNRSSRLGDIINSDPHFVHDENFGYTGFGGAEGASYSTFMHDKKTRTPVVYAAANDGMLHGFRASDGVELFAFVPNKTLGSLPLLLDPAYTHRYFVDGSPTAWDAYFGGTWKTVLTGSLGAGGKAVYALDITDPDSFDAGKVLWEYQGHTAAEKDNLGFTLGAVTTARFPDGHYWTVFGNGYASTSGKSALYMVRVDNPSIVKMIVVGSGPNNGLSTPLLVDSNNDRIVDLVYAGDLKGNLWKFDTSSAVSADWAAAYGAVPLFQAKDKYGTPQPITVPPEVGLPPQGATGLAVYFGTGKYFEDGDNITTSVQSIYGIVDTDGSSGSTDGAFTGVSHRASLVQQAVIFEGTVGDKIVRALSNNAVTYPDSRGWVIDLVTPPYPPGTPSGERVVSGAMLYMGKLVVQTITPSVSPCDFGGRSFMMLIDPATGGELPAAGFKVKSGTSYIDAPQVDIGGGVMKHVSGVDSGTGISGGFGAPIKSGDTAYLPTSGTSGEIGTTVINSGSLKPRATWRQIQ